MNKTLLLSFIFVAVLSSAFAFSNNSSGYYSKGIIVGGADSNNSSGYYNTFIITEQPIGQGVTDGYYSYVGFYPLSNITYYVPFSAGLFTFHCNPSDVELDDSIICTGNLLDGNGTAINNAHIDYTLYSTNGTAYTSGIFQFVGNGAYKFSIPITQAGNFTTGDYYFKFTASGFGTDYMFPVHLSIEFFMQNATMLFVLTMIILGTIMILAGYWRRVMIFVIFGGFTYIVTAMTMLLNPSQFGDILSNAFGIILSVVGIVLLISLFLERIGENRDKKEREQ
jgi:hypothetical protein